MGTLSVAASGTVVGSTFLVRPQLLRVEELPIHASSYPTYDRVTKTAPVSLKVLELLLLPRAVSLGMVPLGRMWGFRQ